MEALDRDEFVRRFHDLSEEMMKAMAIADNDADTQELELLGTVLRHSAQFCTFRAEAVKQRLKGNIQVALRFEMLANEQRKIIPEGMRW